MTTIMQRREWKKKKPTQVGQTAERTSRSEQELEEILKLGDSGGQGTPLRIRAGLQEKYEEEEKKQTDIYRP